MFFPFERRVEMKTGSLIIFAIISGLIFFTPAAFAGSEHGSVHGPGQTTEQGHDMDKGGKIGKEIHMSTVDGHHLAYHLIDMKEKMAGAGGKIMEGHDMDQMESHHLMLYVVGPDGKKVTEGKVGYKVEGPDGRVQKAMAMGMNGAFGADIDFKVKGTYTIKTKVVADGKKLIDTFSYKVD